MAYVFFSLAAFTTGLGIGLALWDFIVSAKKL